MKKLVLGLILGMMSAANAADVTVSWTNPTKNVDGSSIPASGPGALTSTRIEWGTCDTLKTAIVLKQGEVIVSAPATSTKVLNLSPATYCFRAFSSTSYGSDKYESDPSAVASKSISVPNPMPPVILTVTETIVYSVNKQTDKFVMVPVGTVPVNTACIGTQSVNGLYAVPRSKVTWTGTIKPLVVVAKCSHSGVV